MTDATGEPVMLAWNRTLDTSIDPRIEIRVTVSFTGIKYVYRVHTTKNMGGSMIFKKLLR